MKKLIVMTALLAGAVIGAQAGDAKGIWEKQCTKCHGSSGNGDTKMGKKLKIRDLTDAKTQAELTDAKMTDAIKNGVKEDGKTKMKPAEGVSDGDIKDLVAFVRTLKK